MKSTIEYPASIDSLPKELVDFARRQIVNATMYKGDERRQEDRHMMMLPVRAVRVDENNQPLGETFDLITRDVSASAIGLIHSQRIHGKRLAIQFVMAGTEVNLVIDIAWSGPMGPFYGAGGPFVERLDQFPVGS